MRDENFRQFWGLGTARRENGRKEREGETTERNAARATLYFAFVRERNISIGSGDRKIKSFRCAGMCPGLSCIHRREKEREFLEAISYIGTVRTEDVTFRGFALGGSGNYVRFNFVFRSGKINALGDEIMLVLALFIYAGLIFSLSIVLMRQNLLRHIYS